MTRVNVNPTLLRWALERSSHPEGIKRKLPKLDEWLEGKRKPTLRQLEVFAKATATPFGYFFLTKPPDERLPIPLFRTLGSETVRCPSPEFLETVQVMQRRQDWMREYLVERKHEPLPFVGSAGLDGKHEHIAHQIRSTLGIGEEWASKQHTWTEALRGLQRRVEKAGIIVATSSIVGNNTRRKLNPTEFRGFVLVDAHAPLVFINSADFKAAQTFTLAHELAHIWLGSSAAFDLRNLQPAHDETEEACNRIAAEFLVPAAKLSQMWPSAKGESEPFQFLARHFKVSELVVARRALDLGLITKEFFFEFYRSYRKRVKETTAQHGTGGDFYATQTVRLGRRFAETVVHAVWEGALLYHEAYRLTGLYGRTFERFVARLTGD